LDTIAENDFQQRLKLERKDNAAKQTLARAAYMKKSAQVQLEFEEKQVEFRQQQARANAAYQEEAARLNLEAENARLGVDSRQQTSELVFDRQMEQRTAALARSAEQRNLYYSQFLGQ
jgi:hypothetical protein